MAWKYVYYRERQSKISPAYYSCPTECPDNHKKPFDASRRSFCENCPVGSSKDKFKESVLKVWTERIAPGAKKFRFETLLETLQNVIAAENKPKDKISVKQNELLTVYLFEKHKADAIKEFNERKTQA